MNCSQVQCNLGGNSTNNAVDRAGCNSFVIYLQDSTKSLSDVRQYSKILNQGVYITQVI